MQSPAESLLLSENDRLRAVLSATCENNRRLAGLKDELAECLAETVRTALLPDPLRERAVLLLNAAGICLECGMARCCCPTICQT